MPDVQGIAPLCRRRSRLWAARLKSALPDEEVLVFAGAWSSSASLELWEMQPDVILLNSSLGSAILFDLQALCPEARLLLIDSGQTWDSLEELVFSGAVGIISWADPDAEILLAIRAAASRQGLYLSNAVLANLSTAPPQEIPPGPVFTRAEVRVIDLLLAGRNEKEIATDLRLATGTVHAHLMRIYRKLRVHSRGEAIRALSRFRRQF